ncbi:Phosphatidylinositol glycan anchor biosynthesis class U protein [Echinococcus granulosus]|uniref:Phosphatidylinositol glycan anchor biosynthesis class U protein n=1 Tax=Echinococcus granulosus TaxID=6210 RepID=W6UQ64_ECHGR|nr:Phosphatidylinositol glycan anchor biosynthesis class U protein [Echinococcus granulosus]EUB55499.1 Phosphatidylinositol glycan anchor biosynthesis class U protein [Echinococcus granulosus]
MLAVLAQCRNCKSRVFSSLIAFTLTLAGLLFSTYYFENSWSFLRYCYISNEDPLFLALLLTMTTGVLRPYNSVADLGCSLALLMHWRHIFIYFKNTFILSVLAAVALILAPLFYLTWLHTGTSNANFYFSASLIIGIVRVQLLIQTISAYLRYQFHQKFGPQPCLSTGTKIVPCIRS